MVETQKNKSSLISKKPLSKGQALLKQYKNNIQLVIMIVPALIALFLFCYMPMYGLIIAFKDYKVLMGVFGSPWVGLQHFNTIFAGQDFLKVLKNTVVISLLKLVIGFPAPIVLALLLNEVRSEKYKRVIQTFSYLPHFFSWVVLGGIITMIFSVSGPINIIFQALGAHEALVFFRDGNLFRGMLIGTAVWSGVGWGAIIYIAALSGIDASLYEAAYIDGANRWKQVLYISIPCLMPTIVTVLILNMGSVLNAGFDQIYNLYNPMVYDVADILDTYVLRKLQTMEYGLGTAVGLFKSLVGLTFILGTNWLVKKMSDNELSVL